MYKGISGNFREECSPSDTETFGYRHINNHIDSLCPLIPTGYINEEFKELNDKYNELFCKDECECKNKSLQECILDSNCRFGVFKTTDFSDYRCQPDESNSDQADEIPPCDEILEGDVNAAGFADCWCADDSYNDKLACEGASSPFQGGAPNFCKWDGNRCVPKDPPQA